MGPTELDLANEAEAKADAEVHACMEKVKEAEAALAAAHERWNAAIRRQVKARIEADA